MENNIFLGGGFFGSRQLPVVGPALGQLRTGYSWNQFSRPMNQSVSRLAPARLVNPGSVSRVTRPTAQPVAASPSDVHCYYCEGLPEFPTYWMSESQAAQWNQDRDARCTKVNSSECQKKYNQMQVNQQASLRRTGFNAFNLPGSTTYASSMSSCSHRALSKPYLGQALRCWKTKDGGVVCSDLMYHPPGCGSAPTVTESEVLPTPPEASQQVCTGMGIKVSPSAIPLAAPSGQAEQPSEFPVVPVAIGGAALIGLILALR